jgi:hypothetical protein
MRLRHTGTLLLAALALQPFAAPLHACGDKFLMIGKGAKFRQAYAAIYPASVIVFVQPERDTAKAIQDPRLLADLKRAGHRVAVVETERALSHALASDRVDLLLTDAVDADRVALQADSAPTRPRVLPVMAKPSGDEAKAIEARFQYLLTSSDRSLKYLSVIDDAMKARKKKVQG